MLVPTVAVQAAPPYTCGGTAYDASNPDHIRYGRTTPVVDGKMRVDLSRRVPAGPRFVVFWDEQFAPGSDGVVIVGSDYRDSICGTTGDDRISGMHGNDRIFGLGSNTDYDATSPEGALLGDHLFGGKGHDLITNGSGVGFAALAQTAALIGGGKGNDVLYSGDGSSGTPWVRGGVGDDSLFGGLAGSGHMLRGGAGNDTVDLWGLDDSVGVGNAGDDALTSRWGYSLTLNGNTGDDTLIAGWGDYLRLFGGAGDDSIRAGIGDHQTLFGGGGADVIRNVGAGTNQMFDGGPGDDLVTPASVG